MIKTIPLPQPTSHTMHGPIVVVTGGSARILNDNEEEAVWTEIIFDDVLAVRTCGAAACGEDDVVGFDYMVEDKSGDDLERLFSRWAVAVGWQERDREKVNTFSTYRIFFDDAAAVVVVASRFSIQSPSTNLAPI